MIYLSDELATTKLPFDERHCPGGIEQLEQSPAAGFVLTVYNVEPGKLGVGLVGKQRPDTRCPGGYRHPGVIFL